MPLYIVTDKPFFEDGEARVVRAFAVNAWRAENACYSAMQAFNAGYASALYVRQATPVLHIGRPTVMADTGGMLERVNDTERRFGLGL